MAYAVHWQINFVALLTNDAYKVEILQDGYSDDIVHLLGAENPFETTEDNNDDAFTPIRKQTGSLRIADTGYDMEGNAFDYTELLPNDTFDLQVKLWKVGTTDTLRWIGFIRPDSLTSKMYEKVSIREYKLTCPLGTLYEVPVSFSNNKNNGGTIKTIGQILSTALGSITGITWSQVYKQNNVYQRKDLLAKISLLNFISKNEPTHSTPPSGDIDDFTATWTDNSTSWGSVLEEICKFWGWTLYSRSLDLYIVTRNQRDKFARIAFANIADNTDADTQDIDLVQLSYTDLNFASTNHTECRRLGYKNIIVESDVNEENNVIDADYQKAEFSYWVGGGTGIVHVSGDGYLYVLRRLGASASQHDISDVYFDNYQIRERRALPNGYTVPFVIEYSDGWKNDDYKNKTEFELKKGIVCYTAGQSSYPLFFVKTLDDICVPLNSVICIKASVELSYNPDPDQDWGNYAPPFDTLFPALRKPILDGRTIKAALKIGDYWWDDTNKVWTLTPTDLTLTVRDDGSIVSPQNTFHNYQFNPDGILWDNHYGSDGFCIYMNSSAFNGNGIAGRMELIIQNNPYTNGETADYLYNCILNSLSVSIYNTDSKLDPQNKSSHEFKDVASTKFRNDLNVNLKMASGSKNLYGLGQLFNSDLSLLETITFKNGNGSTTVLQPEQRLLQRMKEFYSNVSVQNTIEVIDDEQAELPSTVIYNQDLEKFHIQSVTHAWRNGTVKLTLINN